MMISAYYENFFAEEETRILPILKEELEKKKKLAESVPTEELLEDLSHGVKLDKVMTQPRLVLVPSYWSSPLILYNTVSTDTMLMVFGCRPPEMTLIPGEAVPDRLLSVLKSLADPTRLQMLRFLSTEPLTAAELARKLRLRPPTVTHHLQLLRLAGLVQIHLEPDGERKYTLRSEALQEPTSTCRTIFTKIEPPCQRNLLSSPAPNRESPVMHPNWLLFRQCPSLPRQCGDRWRRIGRFQAPF